MVKKTKARGGREKYEWEKEFAGTIRTKMDIYNLKMADVAKVVGVCEDNFSAKLNDPKKFNILEWCRLVDFLHIDRANTISNMFKEGES